MKKSQCRIIGGCWRGRLIQFPEAAELRPSGDRIRETLFNWLQQAVVDITTLDLFAGSGVLGFESLSRGAAQAFFVDQNPLIIKQLHATAENLSAHPVTIIQEKTPSLSLLNQLGKNQFNLVFVDPPFNKGLVASTCDWLATSHLLAPNALIYIEAERTLLPLPIPDHWEVLKSKVTGQVGYHLIRAPSTTSISD